jgi:hypothetical protein
MRIQFSARTATMEHDGGLVMVLEQLPVRSCAKERVATIAASRSGTGPRSSPSLPPASSAVAANGRWVGGVERAGVADAGRDVVWVGCMWK